jgi:hypothetical protein
MAKHKSESRTHLIDNERKLVEMRPLDSDNELPAISSIERRA